MRLITRPDFDGLGCAVLLDELRLLDDIQLAHPKDAQDGLVPATETDIVANLPYIKGCGLWFDHHSSEWQRGSTAKPYQGESRFAPSSARIIFDYYGGRARFGSRISDLIDAVDKADSGRFTADEILHPSGWDLVSFLLDGRTGLERYQDYRIDHRQLILDLVKYCRELSVDEILALPDVQERVRHYFEQETEFVAMLAMRSFVDGNLIITDLRGMDRIVTGNRFMNYALHPEQNLSVWIIDGKDHDRCVISVGHSIVNRTATRDIGALMLRYGGGGHPTVGSCQVPHADADRVIAEIIRVLKTSG